MNSTMKPTALDRRMHDAPMRRLVSLGHLAGTCPDCGRGHKARGIEKHVYGYRGETYLTCGCSGRVLLERVPERWAWTV
jgi:hypothetical protein